MRIVTWNNTIKPGNLPVNSLWNDAEKQPDDK